MQQYHPASLQRSASYRRHAADCCLPACYHHSRHCGNAPTRAERYQRHAAGNEEFASLNDVDHFPFGSLQIVCGRERPGSADIFGRVHGVRLGRNSKGFVSVAQKSVRELVFRSLHISERMAATLLFSTFHPGSPGCHKQSYAASHSHTGTAAATPCRIPARIDERISEAVGVEPCVLFFRCTSYDTERQLPTGTMMGLIVNPKPTRQGSSSAT